MASKSPYSPETSDEEFVNAHCACHASGNVDRYPPYDELCAGAEQRCRSNTDHKDDTCEEKSRGILDVFDNKNRHNKNVVIWKDGYIVPLSNVALQVEYDVEDYFGNLDEICKSDSFKTHQVQLDRGGWTNDRSPDFETDTINLNASSATCSPSEVVVEISRTFEKHIYKPRETKELAYQSDDSLDELLSINPEDIGSRVNEKFACSITGCECTCDGRRECKSYTASDDRLQASSGNKTGGSTSAKHEDEVYSERSSYSTDSGDESAGYEIIDWGTERRPVQEDAQKISSVLEEYDTPPTSPKQAPDALAEFHTAPTSPGSKNDSFCVINIPDDEGARHKTLVETKSVVYEEGTIVDCLRSAASKNDGQSNNAIASNSTSSSDMYALDTWDLPARYRFNDRRATGARTRAAHIDYSFTRPRHSYLQRRRGPQSFETPPLIDVQSIQYEADPATGKLRTVGKGSFGQVFSARFCDQRFHHLRIVVKEFDEEFTNRREIVEEAQRLLYLRDTGYVPVCYGLVNLGAKTEPRYGIVQEYVGTGLTLEQMIWDRYDLPLDTWLAVALQCCDGLDSFHRYESRQINCRLLYFLSASIFKVLQCRSKL